MTKIMTDVNIVDIGGLPPWATDSTLEKILDKLPEYNKKGTIPTIESLKALLKEVYSDVKKDTAAVDEAVNLRQDLAKALGKVAEEIQESVENQKKDGEKRADTGRKEQPKSFAKGSAIDSAKGVSGLFGELSSNIFDLNNNVVDLNGPMRHFKGVLGPVVTAFPKLAKAIPLLGAAVGAVTTMIGRYISIIMDSANVFRSFNEIGLRGINTTAGLYRELETLAMTSAQFETVMKDYATAMGTFGMTSLSGLVSRVEDADFQLSNFALTTAEGAIYAGQFLQQQRLSGIFTRRSEQEQRKQFEQSIEAISGFSSVMNVSRQKIMESVTKILEQDRIRSVFAGIRDERERERVSESIRGVVKMFTALGGPGEQFAELFSDMTSLMDPVMSEGFQQLVPFAGEAAMSLANLARRARAGELSTEQQIDGVLEFGAALDRQRHTITQFAELGDEGARRLNSLLLQYDEAQDRFKKGRRPDETFEDYMKRQGETAAEAAKSGVLLDDALKRVRVGFDRLLVNFIDTIMGTNGTESAMKKLADIGFSLGKVFNRISNWFEKFMEETGDASLFTRLGLLLSQGFEVIFKAMGDALVDSESWTMRHIGRGLGGTKATDPIEILQERANATAGRRAFLDVASIAIPGASAIRPVFSGLQSDANMIRRTESFNRVLSGDDTQEFQGIDRAVVGQIRETAATRLEAGDSAKEAGAIATREALDNLRQELHDTTEAIKTASNEEKQALQEQLASAQRQETLLNRLLAAFEQ